MHASKCQLFTDEGSCRLPKRLNYCFSVLASATNRSICMLLHGLDWNALLSLHSYFNGVILPLVLDCLTVHTRTHTHVRTHTNSIGAAIYVATQGTSFTYSELLFNPQCFLLYEDEQSPPENWTDVRKTTVCGGGERRREGRGGEEQGRGVEGGVGGEEQGRRVEGGGGRRGTGEGSGGKGWEEVCMVYLLACIMCVSLHASYVRPD